MSEKLEVEFIERSATRSQKMINDELLSEPEALFELADREFSEKKLAHRVSAILAAQKQKAKLERLLALVNAETLCASFFSENSLSASSNNASGSDKSSSFIIF